jgi:hypothetical protein
MATVFVLSKCLFLAPYRAGWGMLLANLVYEIAERKCRCRRLSLDAALWLALVGGSWCLAGPMFGAIASVVLGLVWVGGLTAESRSLTARLMRQQAATRGRVPLPVPQLIVTVRGPVLDRRRTCYELGDWPEGLEQAFEVIVLNPSTIRPQLPLTVEADVAGDGISLVCEGGSELSCPEPGAIASCHLRLKATRCGDGAVVRVRVAHGDFVWERRLRVGRVVKHGAADVRSAVIRRWKHGAGGAFVWRGDQDLYDPATFQSEAGLRIALGLGRRFRMPSSLMLSARLSLVEEEHRSFCNRFGWDRKTDEIPAFARFLREDVDTSVEQEWPTETNRPFSAEIGNHMYLHYGTHAAADADNGWKSHVFVGAGKYPWLKEYPCGSFEEQRDNAAEGSRVVADVIGVAPTSFTIPSDVYDGETARAVEAAGIEVGSETDCGKLAKQVLLPPPHHPKGCDRLVELTRMSPRDPENVFQLAMLKFWVGAVRRTGRVLVYLAHHHLARYEGDICYRLTEELFRHVLADQEGDVHVGTLTAVGRYWRDVLSERTRCVSVTVGQGRVTVTNAGVREWAALPVEVTRADGGRHMRLVTVPPHTSVTVEG